MNLDDILNAQIDGRADQAQASYELRTIDTNECKACDRWFYGDGFQCQVHGEETQDFGGSVRHVDCGPCRDAYGNAVTMAKVTGSVESTHTDGDHSATATRIAR